MDDTNGGQVISSVGGVNNSGGYCFFRGQQGRGMTFSGAAGARGCGCVCGRWTVEETEMGGSKVFKLHSLGADAQCFITVI